MPCVRRSRCTSVSPALNCLRSALSAINAQSFAVRYTNPVLAASNTDTSGVAFSMDRELALYKDRGVILTEQQGRRRLAEKAICWNLNAPTELYSFRFSNFFFRTSELLQQDAPLG